jgi:uncharacterized protein
VTAATLDFAATLPLPYEIVTQTNLIVGARGSGKTSDGVVLAEELIKAGLRVCVIDPTGVWWGLRAAADGTGPGLPVVIFGGEHADLPLPPDAGTAMADLITDQPDLVCVLDLKLMRKNAQRRFMTGFLEQVYARSRDPLHLIIDEADLFCPQRATADIARLVGAYEDVVRRGRVNGLGCTSITQRPSGMNTDIRSQAATLICHQLLGLHDIRAIDDWINLHADDPGQAAELKRSLPKLPPGTAWVWSPQWLGILRQVQVRARRTFDSSATPKVGQTRITPRAFAPVDLAGLETQMAVMIEQSCADDPAVLHARIAALDAANRALTRQLDQARQAPAAVLEVPVLEPGHQAALEQVVAELRGLAAGITPAVEDLRTVAGGVEQALAAARPASTITGTGYTAGPRPAPPTPAAPPPPAGPDGLPGIQRAFLAVLARHPAGLTRRKMAVLAGYSGNSGSTTSALAAMRAAGYINRGTPIKHTPEGLAALGETYEPPPEPGPPLAAYWLARLDPGPAAFLRVFIAAYPNPVTRAELAEQTGRSANSGTTTSALAELRALGLITGSTAHPDLAGTTADA